MKPIKTMMIKANFATIVFDSKNSLLASTRLLDEKSLTALFKFVRASPSELVIFPKALDAVSAIPLFGAVDDCAG
jgi:hypothetical protein